MILDNKKLVFYNKEGNHINFDLDGNNRWNGKLYFDNNSTDTFKTHALYIFETVDGTNNEFNSTLNKFQLFNTNNFDFIKSNNLPLLITNIERSNESNIYFTKWIYGVDIEKYFIEGMYCYFTGLNSFHNSDFDELILNETQSFQILKAEQGRILIKTNTDNSIAISSIIPNTYINPLNIIEVTQINEPIWNETNLNSKLYSGKKLLYDENEFEVKTVTKVKTKNEYVIDNNAAVNIGDKLLIEIDVNIDNVKLHNGITIFNGNTITLTYIPKFLKVGQIIQAVSKNTSVLNTNNITITDIDFVNNIITVQNVLTTQTVDCILELTTNKIKIESDILLDINNNPSLNLTLFEIYEKYKYELNAIELKYNDTLKINHLYSEDYLTVTQYINGINIPITTNTYTIYPISVNNLNIDELVLKDTQIYSRIYEFNSIDNNGLNFVINGKLYDTDFDTDVQNTINDWVSSHASDLSNIGIVITSTINSITISTDYPNVPIFVEPAFGDITDYLIKYKSITFNNIKTQLLITINGVDYLTTFTTNDVATINQWIFQYKGVLNELGIIVENNNTNTIDISLKKDMDLNITYNIGYMPKTNDDVLVIDYLYNNEYSVLNSNEIIINNANLLNTYSIGQKISIKNSIKLNNKSYNIIDLSDDTITLSYQGSFWDDTVLLNIISDYTLRYPRMGLNNNTVRGKLEFSWKDTQTDDFFYYDFSGNQLETYNNVTYNGITPLCGNDGKINLKLISKPNDNIKYQSDPTKQQTVFDKITFNLPTIDDEINEPMQLFIGYNSKQEGWNKARTYMSLIEDLEYVITTTLLDNLITFKKNYVEVTNVNIPFSFIEKGFTVGQIIEFSSKDNTDSLELASLKNNGYKYTITKVYHHKLVFKEDVIEEISIINVPTNTPPFIDINGNVNMITRTLDVTIKVQPQILGYFDFYGQSEGEDERHLINLNNRNLNILKLQDYYIFKSVDINDKGIDWIFMNRKRKELLEIYPQIFNNVGTYKSIIQSINFFGYNDLTMTEYFQNINPKDSKFGQLFNMELLNIFDKSVDGFEFSNLAYKKLRNAGFRKTNLFSLNYKITDMNGNFVTGYSLEEVKIKLLGLKKWLTDNIIPIGTDILSINGKYKMPQNYTLSHESYKSQRYRVEEYAAPIDFNITGNLTPITNSTVYNINCDFFNHDDNNNIEFYEYEVKTFNLPLWNDNINYNINDNILYNNTVWVAKTANINEIPTYSDSWEIDINYVPNYIQQLQGYKWLPDVYSFNVDSTIDPHFIVTALYHSGYGIVHRQEKIQTVLT